MTAPFIAAKNALARCKNEEDIVAFLKRVEASQKLNAEEKEELSGFWVDNQRKLIWFEELPV